MSGSTILNNPHDVATMRLKLFDLAEPLRLSETAYNLYFPYVDNVWSHHRTNPRTRDGITPSYYHCRQLRTTNKPKKGKTAETTRIKRTRQGGTCQMKLKVERLDASGGGEPQYILKRHGDATQHTHTLLESDATKRNSVLRNMAKDESSKGYPSATITYAMRGLAHADGRTNLEAAGGRYLNRQDVANAGASWRAANPDPRKIKTPISIKEEISDAEAFLSSKHYHHTQICTNEINKDTDQPTHGLVFAFPNRLRILERRGFLTLMDATHNTNFQGWAFFTLMVRDEQGCWSASAHFLVSNQTGKLIAEALITIKSWCKGWVPRYFLTDDSAAEQLAVRLAFPGLEGGETEVQHLLCTVHSMRTLDRKLKKCGEAKAALISAMFRRTTQPGCLEDIKTALKCAKDSAIHTYIEKEWLATRSAWAMYARQHIPLLLQVSTTNPVEAWHRRIKFGTSKGVKSRFSFRGTCQHIHEMATQLDSEGEKIALNFRGSFLIETEQYPEMRTFPLPIQQLLVGEIQGAERRILGGKSIVPLEKLECLCGFYRKYLLPCRHIFHSDRIFGVITSADWEEWAGIFEEGGYEVYESVDRIFSEEGRPEIEEGTNRKLEMQEVLDRIRARFFELEQEVQGLEQGGAILDRWLQGLSNSGTDLEEATLQELADIDQEEAEDTEED